MAYVGLIYWCPVTRCRKEMALRSVHVDARVVDLCANVQITQRYVNNTPNPVEAVYVFPLDNRSAVSGFEVEIDGKVTKADVQEKAEARQTYENAVAAGDSAQLLERVKDDVFQMSVGNLKPWSTTVIRITYVADVAIEGDGVLFFLPTFVAPRYTPAGTEAVPNSDGSAAPDGLRLDVVAAMSSDIVSMTSQTEGLAIVTTPQPGNARVQCAKLANDVMSLSKDLIIKITTKEPHKPRCLVEHDTTADTYAAVVTLAPQIDFDDEPCELIFIVDRSGSMSGYNIEKAKKALELFFRSLPEDCYINIVGFGSRFTKLFSKSKKYGEDSLKEATKHIANLKADLGGTEIAAPLRDVFRQPQVKGYARQVFVLTDGQVSNTDETIRIVREEVKAHPTTRVFALGLGNGASHELVEGIAEAGQGTAAFCVGDENLREKVVSQLSRAIQPALTDVTIEWVGAVGGPPSYEAAESAPTTSTSASGGVGGLLSAFAPSSVGSLLGFSSRTQPPINPADAEGFVRAPFHAPPIVTGSRFLSYCLVKKGGKPPTSVRITAKSPVGPLDVSLPVTQADVVQGSLLHTMAARALINDLQREKSWMHVGGSIGPAAIKDEIVRLGTTYSLASKHTSFVAVQKLDGGPVRYEEDIPQFRAADLAAQSRCFASSGAAPKMKKKGGFNFFGAARGRNSAGTSVRGGGRGSTRSAPKKASASKRASSARRCAPPPPAGAPAPLPAPSSAYQPAPCLELCDDTRSSIEACMDSLSSMPITISESDDDMEECEDIFDAPKESEKSEPKRRKSQHSKDSAVLAGNDLLEALLKYQDFSGSFSLSSGFVALIGCDMATVKAAVTALASGLKIADVEKMLATALAIVFMRMKLSALQSEWKLVEAKASKYVKKIATTASIDSEQPMDEARRILQHA